ncbi:MAG: Uma2 family endonuclease, partial [Pyrinomonadaceae bacterium]|nr:Uma2 family endonuclease [Pyrinomonadaceae bacterium]
MQAVKEISKKKRVVKLGNINLKFPEPFFFVVKVPGYKFTDEELYQIDADNEDFRIETNANGDLEIMPPP